MKMLAMRAVAEATAETSRRFSRAGSEIAPCARMSPPVSDPAAPLRLLRQRTRRQNLVIDQAPRLPQDTIWPCSAAAAGPAYVYHPPARKRARPPAASGTALPPDRSQRRCLARNAGLSVASCRRRALQIPRALPRLPADRATATAAHGRCAPGGLRALPLHGMEPTRFIRIPRRRTLIVRWPSTSVPTGSPDGPTRSSIRNSTHAGWAASRSRPDPHRARERNLPHVYLGGHRRC